MNEHGERFQIPPIIFLENPSWLLYERRCLYCVKYDKIDRIEG